MADSRGRVRTWAFIVYPDSAPDDWMERLEKLVVPAAVSPLHDRDVWTLEDEVRNPEHVVGERKKSHYHVVLYYSAKKTPKQVLMDVSPLGVTHVEPVRDVNAYNRYLCHLDQPDKAQYDTSEVVRLNGAACDMARVLTAEQRREVKVAITNHVREFGVTEYSELVFWCIDHEPDWAAVAMSETIYFRGLLASVRATQAYGAGQNRIA